MEENTITNSFLLEKHLQFLFFRWSHHHVSVEENKHNTEPLRGKNASAQVSISNVVAFSFVSEAWVMSAEMRNGDSAEIFQVFVHELNQFVTVQLLEETPAVPSLCKLCEDLGSPLRGSAVKSHD